MSGITKYLLLAGAMVCLSACNSIQELAQVAVDDARAEGTFGFDRHDPAHDVMDMNVMADRMSTDSVDIYSLDDSRQEYSQDKKRALPPMDRPYPEDPRGSRPSQTGETISYGRPVYDERAQEPAYTAQAAAQRGLPSTDSSVTLYPLDPQQSAYPVSRPLYPPQQQSGYPLDPQAGMGAPMQQPYMPRTGMAGMPMQQPSSMPPTGVYVPGSVTAMYEQQKAMQIRTLPARIYFGHGKTTLDPTAKQVLATVAEDVKAHQGVSLRIEGYASSRAVGDPAAQQRANMKTSMDRAKSVAKELIRMGVPENAIQTVGHGASKPLTGHEGVNEEDASRRVEIHQVR